MRRKIVKAIVFCLLFAVLFVWVCSVMNSPGDYRNYQWIRGFYKEPEGSLDAVYIGSSTCYAYWNPLVAWDESGIAVYPYTCNSQHFITAEYLVREVRKTQPDALIIINTNTISNEKMVVEEFHHLFDYMPFSRNKAELIEYVVRTAGLTDKERLELYFPLYRYHDRWSELNPYDFWYRIDGLKGAPNYSRYLEEYRNITGDYAHSEEEEALPDYIREAAESLMDYLDQEGIRALFVTVPRAEKDGRLKQLNTLNRMLRERGFDTLNLLDDTDLLKLDLTQDFYNDGHTNIHGSLKFTLYLSEYLKEKYGLTDKRGDPRYRSWDAGCQKYLPVVEKYSLDIELDPAHRTVALDQPADMEVILENETARLSWSAVPGADGYRIYRRMKGKAWESLGDTAGVTFTDSPAGGPGDADYTVVPYRETEEGRMYGKFDYCAALRMPGSEEEAEE